MLSLYSKIINPIIFKAPRFAEAIIILCILSCHDENATGIEDEPKVNFTFTILDSSTGDPIGDVRITIATINQDTVDNITDSTFGTVTFSDIQSSVNLVTVAKEGYRRIDTLLEVTTENDSIREEFDLSITQTYTFYLVNLDPPTIPKVSYTFTVLDSQTKAPIAEADIKIVTAQKDTLTDQTDSDFGTVSFSEIQSSLNLITITKEGYRRIDTLLVVNTRNDSIQEIFGLDNIETYTFHLVSTTIIPGDSSGPLILTVPPGTLTPEESLTFTLNQAADKNEIQVVVNEVNSSYNLSTPWNLSDENKTLTVALQDFGKWEEGVTYRYTLSAKNDTGNVFHVPGDTSDILIGYFTIASEQVAADKLKFPSNFTVAYWNSGVKPRFDTSDILTSPLPDSTSNMAMLKWTTPELADDEKLADSIGIFIKDNRTFTNWTLWKTISARPDSIALFFFDIYSTRSEPSTHPSFPLLVNSSESFELQFKPKEAGQYHEDKIQILEEPITQGMGERITCKFSLPDTMLIKGGEVSKPINVSFVFSADTTQNFTMDTVNFNPTITVSGSTYDYQAGDLEWNWTTESGGEFTYTGPSNSDLRFSIFSFNLEPDTYTNLNGETSSAPIWMDVEGNFFEVPRE